MTLRLPLALALAGLFTLSACDFAGSGDDITGTWSTTINYTADTLLADKNYRIVADYSTTYTFELINDDGLIYGRITSSVDGTISGQEPGSAPVVVSMDPSESITDYLFGTYNDPVLELDVLSEAYAENLWTFEKVGGRAELMGKVVHQWTFSPVYAAPGPFSFTIDGDEKETTTIRRENRDAPDVPAPSTALGPATSVVHSYSDGQAALNRITVR